MSTTIWVNPSRETWWINMGFHKNCPQMLTHRWTVSVTHTEVHQEGSCYKNLKGKRLADASNWRNRKFQFVLQGDERRSGDEVQYLNTQNISVNKTLLHPLPKKELQRLSQSHKRKENQGLKPLNTLWKKLRELTRYHTECDDFGIQFFLKDP